MTEEPAPRRESAVYGVAGFGTPVGGLGLEVVRRCGEKFELSFGVGEGMAAALAQPKGTFGHAVQWSVMPRVRFGNESDAFTFGVGLSGGEYAYETGFCLGCSDGETRPSATYRTFYTLWTNVEIGGQHLSASGFAFRYFLGLAHGYEVEAGRSLAFPIPYLGVGNLGYAF
ncbi:MAG TPA: hypothetical protein VHK47_14555 [Polyangia bacterium]|nr:hypothetical protein [Polyangia bacterium]